MACVVLLEQKRSSLVRRPTDVVTYYLPSCRPFWDNPSRIGIPVKSTKASATNICIRFYLDPSLVRNLDQVT